MGKTVRFIDLFAGLGGTRLGFEQACEYLGVTSECVFTSEKKPSAIEAYSKNFPGSVISGDITKVDVKDIPDFDYLLGGFPCQPFSHAGLGKGFEDTRGTLFFDIVRIIKAKNPDGFILENVEGLANHDKGKTFHVINEALKELGYFVSSKVIDSIEFGVPQHRKRIYIVGSKQANPVLDKLFGEGKHAVFGDIQEHGLPCIDNDFTKALLDTFKASDLCGKWVADHRHGDNVIHSWDFNMRGPTTKQQKELLYAIGSNQRKKCYAEEIGVAWRDGMPLNITQIRSFIDYDGLEEDLEYLAEKGYLKKRHPYKDGSLEERTDLEVGYCLRNARLAYKLNRFLDPQGTCVTLTATDANKIGVVDGVGVRSLSRREALRLFGFPETYSLDGLSMNKVYDLCGNSICVPVVKAVAISLLQTDGVSD